RRRCRRGRDCRKLPVRVAAGERLHGKDHPYTDGRFNMLGSIGDTLSNFASSMIGNFVDKVMDLAPGLITTALATAANAVVPGSGVLVQAFAGPIVQAGVQAFEQAAYDVLMPAASQAWADVGLPDNDAGNFVNQLGNTFLDGVRQGLAG